MMTPVIHPVGMVRRRAWMALSFGRRISTAAPTTTTTTTTAISVSTVPTKKIRPAALGSFFSSSCATNEGSLSLFPQTGGRPRLEALRERLRHNPAETIVPLQTPAPTVHNSKDPLVVHSSGSSNSNSNSNRGFITDPKEILLGKEEIASSPEQMITDRFGRVHTYLRISLAERCNFRCLYCMPPEGVPLQPKDQILTNEEVVQLAQLFCEAGVNKIRLTGGEPLLRPNLVELISQLSIVLQQQQDNDEHHNPRGHVNSRPPSLGMTTNGFTLEKQLPQLVEAGLTHVNISLDTLKEDKFVEITRRKGLDRVLGAIEAASELLGHNETLGAKNKTAVKVNCVVMKDFNDDELTDFVSQIQSGGRWEHSNVQLRFIEWMPFSDNGWSANRFFSYQDMLDRINHNQENPVLTRTTDNGPNDTTKWYSVADAPLNQRVGFITSMTEHFCGTCNRLRITADGQLKVCLFGGTEVSLRDLLRTQQPHDDANVNDALRHVIYSAVQQKNFALGGHGSAAGIALANDNRPMTLIGG